MLCPFAERVKGIARSVSLAVTNAGLAWTLAMQCAALRAWAHLGEFNDVSGYRSAVKPALQWNIDAVNSSIEALAAMNDHATWRELYFQLANTQVMVGSAHQCHLTQGCRTQCHRLGAVLVSSVGHCCGVITVWFAFLDTAISCRGCQLACQANTETYNAVLYAHGAAGDVDALPSVTHAMVDAGIVPDHNTVDAIVKACMAVESKWAVGAVAIANLKRNDPYAVLTNGVGGALHALVHAKCGRVDTARLIISEVRSQYGSPFTRIHCASR